MAKFVIRGTKGTTFTSTEPGTYGQEVEHDSYEEAEIVLKQLKLTYSNEEFEIKEIK